MKRPKYTVRLLRAAEDDFTDIVSYVAAERPSAAESLAQRIEASLRSLATNPYVGRVPKDALIDLGYRYLIVRNYLIFDVVEERTIFVHRIVHGAGDFLGLFESAVLRGFCEESFAMIGKGERLCGWPNYTIMRFSFA